MDPLSDILATSKLSSGTLANFFFSSPWAIDCGHVENGAPFHVIIAGSCNLIIGNQAPIHMESGDLVVLPHWKQHTLSSGQTDKVVSISHVFEQNNVKIILPPSPAKSPINLKYGGNGEVCHIFSGILCFYDHNRNPIVSSLPDCLHMHARDGNLAPCLEAALQIIATEAKDPKPGFSLLASRLADLLFVEILRSHMSRRHDQTPGLLAAMTDPQMALALHCIHGDPTASWTVEKLACEVGMSRSAFASTFRQLVGLPPLTYLTNWRMHLAANQLVENKRCISAIAEESGYDSDISFARAFKRLYGIPPGHYRRQKSTHE